MDELRSERPRKGSESSESSCSQDVGGEHDDPKPKSFPEMLLFRQDERNRIERVFGKELGAPKNDRDKSKGIKHLRDEKRGS